MVNDKRKTHLVVQINLGQGLTKREQLLLYNAARTCEVGRMISGGVDFEYKML
jgi:hypothetical protein